MSLRNSPDPAVRAAIVKQDLDNVLHPIVQHRALEASQAVYVAGQGSTIVDADGTEYLDAMAALWCGNIGYGRVELAEIARKCRRAQATYFQSRNNGDLRVAKDYERRLDDAIALILDKPKPQQRTLFGGDSR